MLLLMLKILTRMVIKRYADVDEIAQKVQIKKETIQALGYFLMMQVIFSGKEEEFYAIVNSEVNEKLGCKRSYITYEIIYTPQTCAEELLTERVQENMRLLNEEICKSVNSQAQKKWDFEQEILVSDWGEIPRRSYLKYQLPEDYLSSQFAMADGVLKLNTGILQ